MEREDKREVVLKGRYHILGTLGRGAMGTVFLAHDSVMDRRVAVKVLRLPQGLSPGAREEAVQRFYREARLAGKLIHPNIVATFDIDRQGEHHFITMELVEGRTLAAVLEEEGTVDAGRALRIALQVCRALEHAHAQGVVHRDIKPGNIFVLEGGQVKVGDFGIARSMDSATLTQTGYSLGTPQYMSPEQVRGEALDPRSDLFSLGTVLYEMVTGRNPFAADSPAAVIYNILEKEPPLAAAEGEVAALLESILRRALSKGADGRYPDAAHMARDLEEALANAEARQPTPTATAMRESGSTPPAVETAGGPPRAAAKEDGSGEKRRSKARAVLIAVLLLAAAALAVVLPLVLIADGGEEKGPDPAEAIRAFVGALGANDLEEASALLTPRAREELDLERIVSRAHDPDGALDSDRLEFQVVEERPRTVSIRVWAMDDGRRKDLGVWVLVLEGGRWLIDRPGVIALVKGQ